jgi:hypothetical protein
MTKIFIQLRISKIAWRVFLKLGYAFDPISKVVLDRIVGDECRDAIEKVVHLLSAPNLG